MILKLIIDKQSDLSFSHELEFSKFPVMIGRDEKNDVILYDINKIISRKHAKIIDTEGILQLVDLGSSNFTYLNGSRIIPEEENALSANDKITIGDYEIEVQFAREEIVPDDDQKTMVFTNPFQNEINAIADNLRLISEKFVQDNNPMKHEMLRLSLLQNLRILENDTATKTVAEYFIENFFNKSEVIPKVQAKQIYPKEVLQDPPRNKAALESSQRADYLSFSSHLSNTIDTLLEIFGKLVQGFLQFRQEFFGITIYYSIPAGSLSELKDYLFDSKITSEEEKKRHALFSEEAQKLLVHQIGLLEGYKNSVTDGSKYLLQSLDPDIIEKELLNKQKTQGRLIENFIPFVQKGKLLRTIKENYRKYISDPYYIEKKFFRPAFLKGYQKRIPSNNSAKDF